MEKIIINKLGPIKHCKLYINDFMVFTGPQASGKSTIAKSVFFFKNIKNLLHMSVSKALFNKNNSLDISTKNRLLKEIRAKFLQTFGTTWCMDRDMSIEYWYTDNISIRICLKDDGIAPNYIWIELSKTFNQFMETIDSIEEETLLQEYNSGILKHKIEDFFGNDEEIIYIPAGRSMMTLFSSQLMFMYSVMSDDQKRSLDYCTQNYLERIMQMKPYFSDSLRNLIKEKMSLTDIKINKTSVLQCAELIRQILHGEYRSVQGEERLQVSEDRYVKINFASSGQQEAVWILNVVFYYILNNKKAYFIIEEPESHLFPNAQKQMTEFIALAKNAGNKILMTTHSPYILGTVNNLLYANKISKSVDKEALAHIITPSKWVKFETLSAFYVQSGNIKLCVDNEFEAIRNEVIDGASEDINVDFERMTELMHNDEMEA